MGQLGSGKVCAHLAGLWRTSASLVRGLDDLASKHRLKELGFTLLPGMDKMVSKCTEGCCEEKVKKVLSEFTSDRSRNHRGPWGQTLWGNSI